MRAIVLSGGGAKGSYEIGFWKAIRRLNIKYDIVTGTSVGALNAALMVQNDYLKALFLWYNLKYKDIFEINKDISHDEINKFYMNNILKGGIDVSNLELTIKKYINIDKFFKSKIKFGLITVKIPSFKHVEMTKENLTKNNLVDYLVATSSCFPAFKLKKINNNYYIDGGFYDNMPINLAIKMGATDVIAVDLDEIGIKRKIKYNANIEYITPRNKIDSFLKFEKISARRGIRLGYNDTMKYYKKLDGDKYTFKLNNLDKNFKQFSKQFKKNIDDVCSMFNELITKNIVLKKIYESYGSYYKKFNEIIEKSGYIFNIDDSYIYDIRNFNKRIIKNIDKIIIDNDDLRKIKKGKYKLFKNSKKIIKYIYELIMLNDVEKIRRIYLIFPTEFLIAIYIKTIKE